MHRSECHDEKALSYFGECLLCCDRTRHIVYLPCGHIVACLECTVRNLGIELNKKLPKKRTNALCPLCKGVISEAREIYS